MVDTTTLRVASDNFVDQAQPSRSFEHTLKRLELSNGSDKQYAYLHFRQPFEPGDTVTQGKLRVTARGAWSGTVQLTAKRITEPWKAGKLTWNNRPAVSAVNAASVSKAAAPDGWVFELDLQPILQQVADGANWYGVRLEIDNAGDRQLNSIESLRGKPTLTVSWTDAPQAPTYLSPSGGRVVSLAKPVLRCDFTDNAGSETMQAMQVQFSDTSDFTSPDFDSGTFATTEPVMDLTATAFGGLSDGQVVYWRVRVKDGSGQWSGWSDPETFGRDAKGTLAVSSPSSGSPVVSERTPPILFTLTGEATTAYQILVSDADDPTVVFFDSGKTPTTAASGVAQSVTLPKGTIPYDDITYELRVRVWDTKDRETTPGDPRYVELVRLFTFVNDGSPDPVENLDASNPFPTPFVHLTWERDEAPDYFVIQRDGKVIEDELLPEDALDGGSYVFTDYESPQNREHDYAVTACVRGTGCSTVEVVTITPAARGVWILDPDNPDRAVFLSSDTGGFAADDDAAVFKTLGTETSQRIVSALSALEGSLSGTLIDLNGQTASEWEDRLNLIKKNYLTVYRVHIDDFVMRAYLGDIVISPSTSHVGYRDVALRYWQQDPLPFDRRVSTGGGGT